MPSSSSTVPLLSVVARHAEGWDVNWPPIRSRVEAAASWLRQACEAEGRDPGSVRRSQWVFTRLVMTRDDAALEAEFRRINPWFEEIPAEELQEGLVAGPASACRERLAEIRAELGIDRPVLGLTGLEARASRAVLDALAPASEAP